MPTNNANPRHGRLIARAGIRIDWGAIFAKETRHLPTVPPGSNLDQPIKRRPKEVR